MTISGDSHNRAPPRKHSEEKQKEIRKQVDALLEVEVIKESQATEWSKSKIFLNHPSTSKVSKANAFWRRDQCYQVKKYC